MEKENEINELRRRILDKLEDEQQEKLEKEQEHERDTASKKEKNVGQRNSLGEILMQLNKGGEEDEWLADWLINQLNCKTIYAL